MYTHVNERTMNLKRFILIPLLLIITQKLALSAVIIQNDYSVVTTGGASDTDGSPNDPATAMSDLIITQGNNANDFGDAIATATSLTVTNPNADPNSFGISGTNFASASVDRDPGAGNQSPTASATAVYTISFELGINEVGLASFDLDFSIAESNGDVQGNVSWSLTGPDPDSNSIAGNVTGTTANGTSGLQTATLDSAGIYTLTITASVPEQGFSSNTSVDASLDGLTFTLISVPEPSSILMLIVGLSGIIWRRFY